MFSHCCGQGKSPGERGRRVEGRISTSTVARLSVVETANSSEIIVGSLRVIETALA